MPFEIIDNPDPLAAMIDFHSSPVYELVFSINTLFKPPRPHEAWARETLAGLPGNLIDELAYFYKNVYGGAAFYELPVDYGDHSDVPGFFEYVRNLSERDFAF